MGTTFEGNPILGSCKSITFGILPADTIQRASVCNVFESKKRSVHNHVYDPRMGITSTRNNEKCATCLNSIKKCAGHCASINMAVPVLHPMYVKEIMTALQYICYRCNACLVDHRDMPIAVYCKACKSLQPTYTILKDEYGIERVVAQCDSDSLVMAPIDILEKFKKADLSRLKLRYNPRDLVITSLVVLPTLSRPSVFVNGNQCDDDLSYVYIEIIKLNKKIRKIGGFEAEDSAPAKRAKPSVAARPINSQAAAFAPPRPNTPMVSDARANTLEPRTMTSEEIDVLVKNSSARSRVAAKNKLNTETLVRLVGQVEMYMKTLMNNSHQLKYQNEKVIKCIKSRLNGKGGLMRGNIQGKRVDFTGRSVIGCDTAIGVDEIVLPSLFVRSITIPERVSARNYERACKLLADKKVNYIFRGENQYTPRNFKLRLGDIIERHLQTGDYVALNRAPTLHTGSILALKVRIIDDIPSAADLLMKQKEYEQYLQEHDFGIKTIRFNPACCTSLNADFDGDEL